MYYLHKLGHWLRLGLAKQCLTLGPQISGNADCATAVTVIER